MEKDILDCSSGKFKSEEFLCKIAKGMQEKDNHVAFSEIEDATNNIKELGKQIQDIDDLKAIIKPALAKNEKAEAAFNEAFDKELSIFHPGKKKVKEEEITSELED